LTDWILQSYLIFSDKEHSCRGVGYFFQVKHHPYFLHNISINKETMKKILLTAFILSASAVHAGYNYDVGIRQYGAKNFDKAKDSFLKEVIDNPANGNAFYFLGEIDKNAGRFADAENNFRKAISGNVQRKYLSLAYWNLIVLIEQRNDIGELIKLCREFQQKTGDESAKRKVDEVINKLMWTDSDDANNIYKEAIRLKDDGKINEAKMKFQDALKVDSSFLACRFEIGLILYNAGNISEAAQYLKTVGDKIPYYSAVHYLLGEIYYANKSYPASANSFSLALEYGFFDKQTQFSAFLKLSGSYYNLKDYEKAADSAQKALAINGTDREALMLVSAINIKNEKYEEALSSLNKLNSLTPNDNEILFQIGSIYYRMNKEDKYIYYFDTIFTLTSKDGAAVPSKYHKAMLILIKALNGRSEYKRMTLVAAALPESARDYETNLSVARAYYQLREYPLSITRYERLSLNNDDDRLNLCRAYIRTSNKSKAKDLLAPLMKNNTSLSNRALSDQVLSPLAKEIQAAEQKPVQQNIPAPQTTVPVNPVQTTPTQNSNTKPLEPAELPK
jgi:tetratricopeptide (TPR) repeat protein